jgi:peptide/nickel transport system substrate-binding protein
VADTDDNEFGIEGLTGFRTVGTGGFATVYAAWDVGFERWVAVKVLHNLDEAGHRRFDRERVIMGRLSQHRDVVTPFRFGYTSNRLPYLVMEYVGGGSLEAEITAAGRLSWTDAVDHILPVCDALAFAHTQGVLHRDIKPGNILLAQGGAKLADFGIAAIREATATQTAFTLAHTPPETFAGGRDNRDERSDIYSLVSTLYTAIVGWPPLHVEGQDSQPAYLVRIAEEAPSPLPAELAPPALVELVRRGLAKEPVERPQTAEALGRELAEIRRVPWSVEETAVAPAPTPMESGEIGGSGGPVGSSSVPSGDARPDPQAGASAMASSVGGPRPGPATFQPATRSSDEAPAPTGSSDVEAPAGAAGPSSDEAWAPTRSSDEAWPPASSIPSPRSDDPGSGGLSRSHPLVREEPDGPGQRSRRTLWAAVAVAAVVVLAGGFALAGQLINGADESTDDVAGSGDDDSTQPTGDDERDRGDESDGAQPVAEAGAGGSLAIVHPHALDHLNPYLHTGRGENEIGALALEPLAEWTPDGELVPALASHIPTRADGGISDDRREITWDLQPGTLWSDGSPVTAEDVAFTWEYCANPDTGCLTNAFDDVAEVHAVDELRVRIVFRQPRPFPFAPFVGGHNPILQRAQFADCVGSEAAACPANTEPIGTGPFRVTQWSAGSIGFEINPHYRLVGAGKPFFGAVEVMTGIGEADAANAVHVGDADYAGDLGAIDDAALAAVTGGGAGRLEAAFTSYVEHLSLNQTAPQGGSPSDFVDGANPHPVLHANPDLARALSLAVDRRQVAAVYGPEARPTCSLWDVPTEAGPDDGWCLGRDIETANLILDELGYGDVDGDGRRELPDGTPFQLGLLTNVNPERQVVQQVLKENWAEIGVELTLLEAEAGVFFGGYGDGDQSIWRFPTDIAMFTYGAEWPDAHGYLGTWTTNNIPQSSNDWSGTNIPRLSSSEIDGLHTELGEISVQDEAWPEIAAALDDAISQHSGAVIPLFNRGRLSVIATDLQGVGPLNGWSGELWNIEDWRRT